jgi:hypothetical protein
MKLYVHEFGFRDQLGRGIPPAPTSLQASGQIFKADVNDFYTTSDI